MTAEVTYLCTTVLALVTCEWLLARVRALMAAEGGYMIGAEIALVADKWFFTRVLALSPSLNTTNINTLDNLDYWQLPNSFNQDWKRT